MGNSPIGGSGRPWRSRISFINGESSATLKAGNAVVLLSTDPSRIVSPTTAGAAVTPALFAGILTKDLLPGQVGDVIVAGHVAVANLNRMTRTASSDTWASHVAIAIGDYLTVDTVNGKLQRSGAGAAAAYAYQAIALDSMVSQTTLAATVGVSGQTFLDYPCRVWLRALV